MDPVRPKEGVQPLSPIRRTHAGHEGGEALPRSDARSGSDAPPPRKDGARTDGATYRRGSAPRSAAEDLARAAAAADDAARSADPEGERHAARLAALGFDLKGGGDAVRSVAGQGAVPLRVALLSAAAELRRPQFGPAIEALAARLVELLPPSKASVPDMRAAAEAALRQSFGRFANLRIEWNGNGAGVGHDALRQLSQHIVRDLAQALGQPLSPPAAGQGPLVNLLGRVDLAGLGARLTGPMLGAVLALPENSALRNSIIGRSLGALQTASMDPRFATLAELAADDGPGAQRALAQLIGALEGEAAANAARRDAGDPTLWTVPFHDGRSWTTLELFEDRHGRDTRGGGDGDSESTRVAIGTDFSGLGPVRADLVVSEERVVLRMVASEPETARLLRVFLPELREQLATGDREVLLAVADGHEEDARVETPPPTIDHLDVSG